MNMNKPVNYDEFVQKYGLKDLQKVVSIDGMGYWLGWKLSVTRNKRIKVYVYVVKENELQNRFVDIKGFPVEVLERGIEYIQRIKEKLRDILS